MGESHLELALLEIGFYLSEKDCENGPVVARVVKLVRPLLDEHHGFIYSQQPGEIRAAFLEISRATNCLTALQTFGQSAEWRATTLNLSLKLSFEMLANPAGLNLNSKLLAEQGSFQAGETNDWLLGKLVSHLKAEKTRISADRHWYDFFNGLYHPALDWLQKQLLIDQYYSKNFILCTMALLNFRLGEVGETQRLARTSLESFSNSGDMSGQFMALLILAKAARYTNLTEAAEYNTHAQIIRQEIAAGQHQITFLTALGKAARLQHQPRAAFRLYEKTLEISRHLGDKVGEIAALCNLADIYPALRDYPKMADLLDRTLDKLHQYEKGLNRPALLIVMAFLLAEPDDTTLAAELLAESHRLSLPLGSDNPLQTDLEITARIGLGLVPPERKMGLYQRRLALSWRSLNPHSFAYAMLGQVEFRLEQGELNQARTSLRRTFNIALQSRNWAVVVGTLESLAVFWLNQGQDKRATRLFSAAAILRQQFELAVNHLQKPGYEQRLQTLQDHLGPRIFRQTWSKGSGLNLPDALKVGLGSTSRLRPPLRATLSRTEPGHEPKGEISSLSQRENEVLYLVATDLTNSQIAEQMTLSTYTVSSYLRSIYNKLGVTTRTAAASYAFKHFPKLP